MTSNEMGTIFFEDLGRLAGEGQLLFVGPFVIVGDRKGGVLAQLEMSFHPTLWATIPVITIGLIRISPEYRGLGYGRRVLGWIKRIADARGWAVFGDVQPVKDRDARRAPMSRKRLARFYELMGLKVTKGGHVEYRPKSRS